MRVRRFIVPALMLLVGAGGLAQAQSVKPGLWETTVVRMTVDGQDMLTQMNAAQEQMRKSLAQLPPEQRKRMEAMMSGQGAMGMGTRICITPEMAANDRSMMQKPEDSDCDTPKFSKNGNRLNFEMSCRQDGGKIQAKGETLLAENQVTSKMEAVMTEAKGTKRTSVTETHMKFISGNCGSVKPVDQLMKDARSQLGAGGLAPAKK